MRAYVVESGDVREDNGTGGAGDLGFDWLPVAASSADMAAFEAEAYDELSTDEGRISLALALRDVLPIASDGLRAAILAAVESEPTRGLLPAGFRPDVLAALARK